jgi:cellulose synthase (UDP-forming)
MTVTRIFTGEQLQEDPRLLPPKWRSPGEWRIVRKKLRLLIPLNVVLALWYFEWLLRPARVGNPVLFGLLAAAEIFNLVQAVGFWWTTWHGHDRRPAPPWPGPLPEVDVLIPVYNEPLDVVAPTLAAATRMRGARVTVHLLDDAGRPQLADLAREAGAEYITRPCNTGAKAGNLNHALARTAAPFVAIFDCDHVPDPRFLEATLGWLRNENVAFAQTPQYYANAGAGRLAAAAASQQSLFFGGIARGKDGLGSMFCCGTNVLFRRRALQDVEGFPEDSLTEDFQLSVLLHERGWRSVYVNEVLAQGLGPEDMASYVSQQARWARGCLSAVPSVIRASLPWRTRLQYMLSSMFFLSGWTFALYMALPIIRIFFGLQPLTSATSDQFLLHFAPYFCVSLAAVAVAGAGAYTFDAFALLFATFFVQVLSTLSVLGGRRGRFVVTAKRGADHAQPGAVFPTLLVMCLLLAAMGYGLMSFTAASLNNVAFAFLHLSVLAAGSWTALVGRRRATLRSPGHRDPAPLEELVA